MLINVITAYRQSVALHTFVKLGIPFSLGQRRALTLHELSTHCELDGNRLSRLLDVMLELGIVRLDNLRYSLTEDAEVLADENSLETLWILCELGEDYWNMWPHYASSMRSYTSASAFERTHGTPFFSYLSHNPDLKDTFDRLMAKITENLSTEIIEYIECDEHSDVVDIGGGKGVLMKKLHQKYNLKSATVLDLYSENSRTEDGIEYANADFFRSIVAGKEIYILKNIIHDWNDEHALKILENCHRAMSNESRLFVIEIIKKKDSSKGKTLDLLMDALSFG
ncbi:methyltransferase [Mechercharimyces sp. CAU 1602]|uniref:methyltransferase n=1 Tax=Mechercharimyces sp. CAU 1602 TaxID=2973933 RepID=UPI0021639B14|nr:methyltransferase [Mechercharimyces sp. CAU 1602]MCS1352613.1 methyltransferase [Mechercharimyces sp. CAU 1602]